MPAARPLAALAAALLLTAPAAAQTTYTWTGTANSSWTNGGNWAGGGIPDTSGTATINMTAASGGSLSPRLNANQTVSFRTLSFDAATGAFTLGGSANSVHQIGSGGITNAGAFAHAASTDVQLTANQTWTLTGGLSVSGPVSGSFGLTKSGTGTLTLSGLNTYTGPLTVAVGTVQLGAVNTLSATAVVALNGGTHRTGATTGFNQTAGQLKVTAASTITLGTGSHVLRFHDATNGGLAAPANLSALTVTGWTGTALQSGTGGRIVFTGGDLSNLSVSQLNSDYSGWLSAVTFSGFDTGATFLSYTGGGVELVPGFAPVPEPGSVLAISAGVLGLGAFVRRRLRTRS